jgi:hypothetical protein
MRIYQKPDYALKAEVLKTELPSLQREISKTFYEYDVKHSISTEEFEKALLLNDMVAEDNPLYWNEAKKINHATFKRNVRLKNRIEGMLKSGTCLFLTLTFRNDVLDSTSAETRKKYVQRFLSHFSTKYIANIDFGGENGREHYHSVILIDNIDYHLWEYGIINGEKIRYNKDDKSDASAARLAKYTNKLVNHAIKETTKRQALIYSRSAWDLQTVGSITL